MLELTRPTVVAVEDLFTTPRFPKAALKMAHLRGVFCLAVAQAGIPMLALTATTVKQRLTGNGHASKEQVQRMVLQLCEIDATNVPSDLSDAIALAIAGPAPDEHDVASSRGAADDRGAAGHLSWPHAATASSWTSAASATRSCCRRSSSRRSAPLDDGRALDLRIAYIATRDNPIPVLYGFARDEERQFWDLLRSVSRVGPKSAARAMVLPINRIAEAIRDQNTHLVDSLPGHQRGRRREDRGDAAARRSGRSPSWKRSPSPDAPPSDDELRRLAVDLLVEMGIRRPDASRAVVKLLEADPPPRTVEDVVMEYFKR